MLKLFKYCTFLVGIGGWYALQSTQLGYGLSELQGHRSYMEDASFFQQGVVGTLPNGYLAGLFDGHSGTQASALAKCHMTGFFSKAYQNAVFFWRLRPDEMIHRALKESLKRLDDLILKKTSSGTTALIACVNDNKVHFAWVGDSRGMVLSPAGDMLAATTDHKPSSPQELKRYKKPDDLVYMGWCPLSGPKVLARGYTSQFNLDGRGIWRLGPLAVSRVLGDRECRKAFPDLISEPDILTVPLEKGGFIILASDGLWDVMTNEDVAQKMRLFMESTLKQLEAEYGEKEFYRESGSQERLTLMARALGLEALRRGSKDNISVHIYHVQ